MDKLTFHKWEYRGWIAGAAGIGYLAGTNLHFPWNFFSALGYGTCILVLMAVVDELALFRARRKKG